jgi:hypothetical protein
MPRSSGKKQPIALGGVAEVAHMLCISKSALAERRRRGTFPEPLIELACGPIWDLDVIDAYDRDRNPDARAAGRWINYPGRWHAGNRI